MYYWVSLVYNPKWRVYSNSYPTISQIHGTHCCSFIMHRYMFVTLLASVNRWQKAAKTNAMEAMKIKKYEAACGFFILGGGLQDALSICFRQLKDFQLGLCLARLAEGLHLSLQNCLL
jgi:hypothetical protein